MKIIVAVAQSVDFRLSQNQHQTQHQHQHQHQDEQTHSVNTINARYSSAMDNDVWRLTVVCS